ncbi:unnamed protein product [Allacma fusca]|uniref:Uncharacterized protein n=1 Tax=Allacma fusca TaxID=39272 RepID=A0A8J2KYN2_9HEXA|nr:unnamed protein product [Allacma fusca]
MEERKEVNLKQQTLHSFLVALSYVFLGSSEQMVILPSVWPYIQNLSGEPQTYWIGFTISVLQASCPACLLDGCRRSSNSEQRLF